MSDVVIVVALVFAFACVFATGLNLKGIRVGQPPHRPEDVKRARWAWTFIAFGYAFVAVAGYHFLRSVAGGA